MGAWHSFLRSGGGSRCFDQHNRERPRLADQVIAHDVIDGIRTATLVIGTDRDGEFVPERTVAEPSVGLGRGQFLPYTVWRHPPDDAVQNFRTLPWIGLDQPQHRMILYQAVRILVVGGTVDYSGRTGRCADKMGLHVGEPEFGAAVYGDGTSAVETGVENPRALMLGHHGVDIDAHVGGPRRLIDTQRTSPGNGQVRAEMHDQCHRPGAGTNRPIPVGRGSEELQSRTEHPQRQAPDEHIDDLAVHQVAVADIRADIAGVPIELDQTNVRLAREGGRQPIDIVDRPANRTPVRQFLARPRRQRALRRQLLDPPVQAGERSPVLPAVGGPRCGLQILRRRQHPRLAIEPRLLEIARGRHDVIAQPTGHIGLEGSIDRQAGQIFGCHPGSSLPSQRGEHNPRLDAKGPGRKRFHRPNRRGTQLEPDRAATVGAGRLPAGCERIGEPEPTALTCGLSIQQTWRTR